MIMQPQPVTIRLIEQHCFPIRLILHIRITNIIRPVSRWFPRKCQLDSMFLFAGYIHRIRQVSRRIIDPFDRVAELTMKIAGIDRRFGTEFMTDPDCFRMPCFRLKIGIALHIRIHIEHIIRCRCLEHPSPGSIQFRLPICPVVHCGLRCPMRTKRIMMIDPYARNEEPFICQLHRILDISGLGRDLLIHIPTSFIGRLALMPLGTKDQLIVIPQFPAILVIDSLQACIISSIIGRIRTRIPRTHIIIEIPQETWCRLILFEMPGQSFIIIIAFLIQICRLPCLTTVIDLMHDIQLQRTAIRQFIIQTQRKTVVVIIAVRHSLAAVARCLVIEIAALLQTSRQGPAQAPIRSLIGQFIIVRST